MQRLRNTSIMYKLEANLANSCWCHDFSIHQLVLRPIIDHFTEFLKPQMTVTQDSQFCTFTSYLQFKIGEIHITRIPIVLQFTYLFADHEKIVT